ncbi:uncharacterized protein LOC105847064 isoform X2 [Hydra vulgaris]|uniref:Uncharacterized protein LOC105847064 isoform X2 n=1 Tax=Hydra vulgaris TaxID=6087 RepID=A0ABM4BLJ5_HYDVU
MDRIKNTVTKKEKVILNKKDDKETKFISTVCHSLFSGEKISTHDFSKIFDIVQSSQVELEESVIRRGMESLRKEVKEKPGNAYLIKVSDIWSTFYQNILPTLQLWFSNPKGVPIKEILVTSFRDNVILKLKLEESLHLNEATLPPGIKQMFLVTLQVVKDYSENYFKLESLAAKVISPFLGSKGLYVRSEIHEYNEKNKHLHSAISSNSTGSSPEVTESSDLEFEELLNHRRQVFHRNESQQRLSRVEEKGISESLASLLAEGFEIG